MGHDGDGFGAGWFLKRIVVRPVLTPDDDRDDIDDDDVTKRKYVFVCDRWLDAGEDDAKIERKLQVLEKEEKKPLESESLLTTSQLQTRHVVVACFSGGMARDLHDRR